LPSPERLELAQQFLRKAEEDRDAMEILIASDRAADAVIGFHAQQAVEKFAKAVLVARDIEVPRTHDLRFLLTSPAPKASKCPKRSRLHDG
jgi:HEPN domain-containing protein